MNLKWKIFIGLVLVTVVLMCLGFFLLPDIFQPFVYGFLIIPAILFEKMGLPTIDSDSLAWFALPSTLGFILDVVFYLITFYLLASLIAWIKSSGNSKKAIISASIIVGIVLVIWILGEINGCLIC